MKLLKFYADWCEPCGIQSNIINSLSEKISISIENINIDLETDKASRWKVRGIPTLILVDENGEVKRHIGVLDKQNFLKFIAND